ncbi:MAG: DUF4407 domain-containing protein [Ferruginibacter sp.]
MESSNLQLNNIPSKVNPFLCWLATADKDVLATCSTDKNKYNIIGMSVLATWIFASLAWTYFFYTVTNSFLAALFPGLFMGFIILTIDRALIKGLSAGNKGKLMPLLFRAILAVSIGSFMAQPAVLYIFKKEIRMQVSIDNEARKLDKRKQSEAVFANRKKELLEQQKAYQLQLDNASGNVRNAQQQFIAETDGSGGSGLRGIKDIALAKRNEYYKLDSQFQQLKMAVQPRIDSLEMQLTGIENNLGGNDKVFATYLNDGFLSQSAALQNLLKDNRALQYRYYLIVFILVLIELMPVIAKTMILTKNYDEKLLLVEKMEMETAKSKMDRIMARRESFEQQVAEYDETATRELFKTQTKVSNEKIEALARQWKENEIGSFDAVWQLAKNDILSRQEI